MAVDPSNIIGRDEARALGLRRFFTGKLCKRGHLEESFVSSGECMECARGRARAWCAAKGGRESYRKYRTANLERAREYQREYQRAQRAANPERVREYQRRWRAERAAREKELTKRGAAQLRKDRIDKRRAAKLRKEAAAQRRATRAASELNETGLAGASEGNF